MNEIWDFIIFTMAAIFGEETAGYFEENPALTAGGLVVGYILFKKIINHDKIKTSVKNLEEPKISNWLTWTFFISFFTFGIFGYEVATDKDLFLIIIIITILCLILLLLIIGLIEGVRFLIGKFQRPKDKKKR